MAGKPGMHTRVLNPARVEEIREKIAAIRIVNRLEDHIFDVKEMSASQVTAALGLLKKAVPDLGSIEHSGSVDGGFAAMLATLNDTRTVRGDPAVNSGVESQGSDTVRH